MDLTDRRSMIKEKVGEIEDSIREIVYNSARDAAKRTILNGKPESMRQMSADEWNEAHYFATNALIGVQRDASLITKMILTRDLLTTQERKQLAIADARWQIWLSGRALFYDRTTPAGKTMHIVYSVEEAPTEAQPAHIPKIIHKLLRQYPSESKPLQ